MATLTHGLTKASIEAAHAGILASLPDQVVTVSFNGNSVQALKTNTNADPLLADYGRMEGFKFSVRFLADSLPDVEGQKLVDVAGTNYLVLSTHLGQSGALLHLDLGDEHA